MPAAGSPAHWLSRLEQHFREASTAPLQPVPIDESGQEGQPCCETEAAGWLCLAVPPPPLPSCVSPSHWQLVGDDDCLSWLLQERKGRGESI
jgi:hypothetical protein